MTWKEKYYKCKDKKNERHVALISSLPVEPVRGHHVVLVGADPGEGGLPSAGEDEPQGRVVKSMHTGKVPVPLPPNYGDQLPVPP